MWQHKTNLTKMNTKLFKIFFKDLIFTSYQLNMKAHDSLKFS